MVFYVMNTAVGVGRGGGRFSNYRVSVNDRRGPHFVPIMFRNLCVNLMTLGSLSML